MSYLDELSRELARHGIRGQARRRILVESEDHLRSDPGAQERFGSASEVANAFAAELGAQASRRAAISAFAALGVAGAVYAASFVSLSFASSSTETIEPALGAVAFALMIVAPQVSFVSGVLALARALRRRERVLPTKELDVLQRRTGVALVSGLATMGALALYGYELRTVLPNWWLTLTFTSTAVASALLLAAFARMISAALLRPRIPGDAGDVFDDLGVAGLRGDPWRFARRVAFGVGLAVWFAGIVQSDPIDGLIRGGFEGLACLGGFAVLGRYLALRR
jgi:hypothetical protein